MSGVGGMLGLAFYKEFSKKYNLKCTDIDVNEEWLSYLDFRDYQSLILNSSGIIFPSRDEDFGIAALDAYNLNIPVIVQKNCGFSEILPHDYAYYYNDINITSIMNSLLFNSSNGLGVLKVKGFNLLPKPAHKINAVSIFISTLF